MTLGNILPTKASLQNSDDYAARVASDKLAVARKSLADCDRRLVAGEYQHHYGDFYAVVSSSLRVKWFEKRADGDYAIDKDPRR